MEEKENAQEQEKEITKEDLATEAYLDDKPLNTNIFDEFFNDEEVKEEKGIPYTTELLEDKTIKSIMTVDEAKELIDYLEGSGRPDFMEKMLTQTNEKLIEAVKIMTILYLNKIPKLIEYQRILDENLLVKESLAKMNYVEMSKVKENVQKEVVDILNYSLNVAKSLSAVNTIPTKTEKLANTLMNLPESTRQRIEEIIRLDRGV